MNKITLLGVIIATIISDPAIAGVKTASVSGSAASSGNASPRSDMLMDRLNDPSGQAMIVAHRGCHTEAPENSLAAFRRCIALGIDMVETDIQITKDGQLVLMHDATVDRTTNGTGRVADMTLVELKELHLRLGYGGPDAPLTDESIPTFEEAMELMRGQILVDLDAKGPDLEAVWAKSLTLLERMGVLSQMTVKLTAGRDDHLLGKVPLLDRVAYLQRVTSFGDPLTEVVRTHKQYKPVAYTVVFLNMPYLDDGVEAINNSGVRVWVEPFWGATAGGYSDALAMYDPDANWGRLLQSGASMFLTDRPESLALYLAVKGKRSFGK